MKVLIIGCGGQGTLIAARLAREMDVEQIVLGDIALPNLRLAEERVKSLKPKAKIIMHQVDASDREAVIHIARGNDILFNATFPPYNILLMEVCLEIGAHYLDLWSLPSKELPGVKPEWTVDAQLELDSKFRSAGLTAIPCTGAAPGFTDVAARYIADQLETVDTVKLKWGHRIGYAKTPLIGIFAPRELMGEFFSPPGPVVYEDGKFKVVDLLESEEEHEFPEPTGKVTVYEVCTHPEMRTISLALSKINKPPKYVELKGGLKVGNLTMKDIWIKAIRESTKVSTYMKDADLLDL